MKRFQVFHLQDRCGQWRKQIIDRTRPHNEGANGGGFDLVCITQHDTREDAKASRPRGEFLPIGGGRP